MSKKKDKLDLNGDVKDISGGVRIYNGGSGVRYVNLEPFGGNAHNYGGANGRIDNRGVHLLNEERMYREEAARNREINMRYVRKSRNPQNFDDAHEKMRDYFGAE